MSDNLLDALLDDDTEEVTDPVSLHRSSWPLNLQVLDGLPTDKPSIRARLKRAVSTLAEEGISVTGISGYTRGGQLQFSSYFNASGMPHDSSVSRFIDGTTDDVRGCVQSAFAEKGVPSAIDMHGNLHIIVKPIDEAGLRLIEKGVDARSLGKITEIEWDVWLAIIPSISSRDVISWRDDGFSVTDAKAWIDARFALHTARAWSTRGFMPADLAPWTAVSKAFVHVHNLRGWIDDGLLPADAIPWIAASSSFIYRATVKEWDAPGWTPARAAVWSALYSSRVEAEYAQAQWGLSDDDVRNLVAVSYSREDRDKLCRWLDKSTALSHDEMMEWAVLGTQFCTAATVGKWRKAGFTAEAVGLWRKVVSSHTMDLDEMVRLRAEGVDPTASADWRALHADFSDNERVLEWKSAGLDVKDAKEWSDHSSNHTAYSRLTSYSVVRQWLDVDADLTPEAVSKMAGERVTPAHFQLVKEWIVR